MSAKFIAKGSTNSAAKNKTSGTLTPRSGPNVRINWKINFVDNSSSSNVIKAVGMQVCSVDVKDDLHGYKPHDTSQLRLNEIKPSTNSSTTVDMEHHDDFGHGKSDIG
ncbi:unnamed protein product [Prunus brigantina]